MKVLFICSGNAYRSPVAEALLKKYNPEIEADSAGTNISIPISSVAKQFLIKENAKGYLKQELVNGKQNEQSDDWLPSNMMNELPNQVELIIQNRIVKIKAWLYDYQSPSGGLVSVLFLDTDVEGNSQEDREITSFLYGGDREYRLKQEIILGIGGVKLLEAAGFKLGKYHMNEGHSSLLTFAGF